MPTVDLNTSEGLTRLMTFEFVVLKRAQRLTRNQNRWIGLAMLQMGFFCIGLGYASAVDVRHFGARGDGQTDDTVAIEAAMKRTTSGTLVFPPGVYKIKRTLNLRSNVSYQGQGRAVLTGTNGGFIMSLPEGVAENITVEQLVFDGGGLTGQSGIATNIRITGNTFQNLTNHSENWTLRNAIFSSGSFRLSSIDHNTFRNILPNGVTRWDGKFNRRHQLRDFRVRS
jgi:hypothetical protein